MSNYSRGAAQERKTLDKLLKNGCSYAVRAAGSHSEFDIIASDETYNYFVQVKSTRSPPKKPLSFVTKYQQDIDSIAKLCFNNNSLKELWVYIHRKHEPIKIGILPVEKYLRL